MRRSRAEHLTPRIRTRAQEELRLIGDGSASLDGCHSVFRFWLVGLVRMPVFADVAGVGALLGAQESVTVEELHDVAVTYTSSRARHRIARLGDADYLKTDSRGRGRRVADQRRQASCDTQAFAPSAGW
jgi:hypothetical protein